MNLVTAGAGAGVLKVFHEKRKDDIPLIDNELEEKDEEKEEEEDLKITPPLAEPESLQLSSMESIKEENKEFSSKENQELEKNDEKRLKILELFKSLPMCTDITITEKSNE